MQCFSEQYPSGQSSSEQFAVSVSSGFVVCSSFTSSFWRRRKYREVNVIASEVRAWRSFVRSENLPGNRTNPSTDCHFLLSFFIFFSSKKRNKKDVLCGGVFWATRPKNRKSAAKFSPGLQKFLTLLIFYTHTRSLCFATLERSYFTLDYFLWGLVQTDITSIFQRRRMYSNV